MAGVRGKSGGGIRKSVEQLKLEGTYRKDRHSNVLVPPEKRVEVTPQSHIINQNPEIDREELFNYFARTLHAQGMTQEIDSILLSQLVEFQAQYLLALSYYKADPEAVIGKKMAIAIALDCAKEVRSLLSEFRLTPTTRVSNLPKEEKVKYDPVADFLEMKVVNADD
jgi:phage terminase small subunit